MSMISEQVADLREKAQIFEDSGCATNGIVKTFRKAADTIEELSAKLATANMERSTAYYNDGWIPCSSGRMPEHKQQAYITVKIAENRRYATKANYYTETGVVYEDEWTGKGFYSYDSEYGWGRHDDVIAWMPAEPYKGGGVDG